MMHHILLLPGDGIGKEIGKEALKVLSAIQEIFSLELEIEEGLIGGAGIDNCKNPLPPITLDKAKAAHAVLLGAVGGPKWDNLDRAIRPEKGLLAIRQALGLFANLRPAILMDELIDSSSLKPEIISGLDILIIRELTGGIYFGVPRAIEQVNGLRIARNTMLYNENEIKRIAKIAFLAARSRNGKVCSVDKANVLEVSHLWREVITEVHQEYPDVELEHMYVDNAAMQLVRNPRKFDVIVTGNLFGDILSDCAAMLTGSIGMLPSASLNESLQGLYEPVHGAAPDIAGLNQANPLAMILSIAMMFQHTFQQPIIAEKIEQAVKRTLLAGFRTQDIRQANTKVVSTNQMGNEVIKQLYQLG